MGHFIYSGKFKHPDEDRVTTFTEPIVTFDKLGTNSDS